MALREVLAFFGVEFDSTELDKGNESIGSAIGKLKGLAAAVAGSALVVGIRALVNEVRQQSLALAELSGQVNITTDDLQQWQFVGQSLLVSQQSISDGFVELAKKLGEAATKGGDAAKAFSDLNVELKEGDQIRSTADVFDELRAAFAGISSEAERVARAEQLFGGAGRKLLPLLNATTDQVEDLRREFEELGGGIESGTIKTFAEMERENAKLDFAFTSMKANVASSLLPVFRLLAEGGTTVAKWFNEVTKNVDKTQLALVTLGSVALVAGVMLGAAFLPVLLPIAKAVLFIGALIAVTDDLLTAYKGGRSTIALFWQEWTGRNLAEDLHEAVNWADRLFTAFKGVARMVGAIVQVVRQIPENLKTLEVAGDFEEQNEKLKDLIALREKLKSGEEPGFFASDEEKAYAASPEKLEQDIAKQTDVVDASQQRFEEHNATRARDPFEALEEDIVRDADEMNARIAKRTAEGKEAGERSDENIARYRHQQAEDAAGMSLPRGGEMEFEADMRRQQAAEQSLGGFESAPVGVDFGDISESTDALVESNTALSDGTEELQSTYQDAAQKTEQLATTTRDNTAAVRSLEAALRSQAGTQNFDRLVENLNVFMGPGSGPRDAGERSGRELADALRSAAASG